MGFTWVSMWIFTSTLFSIPSSNLNTSLCCSKMLCSPCCVPIEKILFQSSRIAESQLRPSRLGLSPPTTSLASCSLSFTVTMTEPNTRIGSPVYVHNGSGSPEGCSGGAASAFQNLLKVVLLNAAPVSTSMSNG